MIEASCHCGNIQLSTQNLPATLTSCNCSICHRYGALWAYYSPDEVKVNFKELAPSAYSWGDKDLAFQQCTICACLTHYVTTGKCTKKRLAINARMLTPDLIVSLPVRQFDGADSWKYLHE